jgi:hypothetical protein
MIAQLKTLLRVKELKQEQAFRAMQAKRSEVDEAQQQTERARFAVQESASTLGQRKDAVYADVLGAVVGMRDLDETRDKIVRLDQEHVALKDAMERAAHVQHRLEQELESAALHHRKAVKATDKYAIISEELVREADEQAILTEEMEIEELFAKPGRRIG